MKTHALEFAKNAHEKVHLQKIYEITSWFSSSSACLPVQLKKILRQISYNKDNNITRKNTTKQLKY